MTLEHELAQLRHALDAVESALWPLRERPAARRAVQRLSRDLRRMQEDVHDLAAQEGVVGSAGCAAGSALEPIPVPPRDREPAPHPESDGEGLGGRRLIPSAEAPHLPRPGWRR